MKTISESFKIIIDKQNEIGYHMPKILKRAATKTEIKQTENELNLKFNKELIELYSIANGIENNNETLLGLLPIHEFMNLNKAIDYYKSSINFEFSFLIWETNFTPNKKLFPFLEDGCGNCY